MEVTSHPCVACGTYVPRNEMFGTAPDLRCNDCAAELRERLSPAAVRRGPARAIAGGTGRVALGLLALLGVIWVAYHVDSARDALNNLLFGATASINAAGEGVMRLAHAWQPALWAITHISFWHLAMNGFAFWQVGRIVELGWGGRVMLFVVLASGIAGTAAGWLLNGVPTIGLSGGIFGLDGWLLALRRHHPVATAVVSRVFIHSLLASTVLLVLLTELGGIPISHAAHAAGFAFGWLAGMAARSRQPLPLLILLAFGLLALLVAAPSFDPLGLPVRLFGGR
ncbi:MAG: rhomboid family intramembrane serine protease [Planctomycetia bacterium]